MSRKFRKKPVEIEAMLPGVDDPAALMDWLTEGRCPWFLDDDGLGIATLEGEMRVSPGDWIIKGIAGEFYPCKPDIFEQTYEPVA